MFVCRYLDGNRAGYGRVEQDTVDRVVPGEYDLRTGHWVERGGRAHRIDEVTLMPPAEPSKIATVALNYAVEGHRVQRAASAATSAVVLKPASTLAAPGDPVGHPGELWDLKHEAELAVVIGVRCKAVSADDAPDVIAGYTCSNDLTAYAKDGGTANGFPMVWAKHFDGFTPLGPWLATELDAADAAVECTVDGEVRQLGTTRDLIASVHETVAVVSEHMTLLPGDVILTGTPPGADSLLPGSTVEVSIAGVGTLRNVIRTAAEVPVGVAIS